MSARCTDTASIYRNAAKLIETGGYFIEYACEAIEAAGGGSEERDRMEKLFNDDGSYAWLGAFNGRIELERPIRVLALCFMAAMVEAGDA